MYNMMLCDDTYCDYGDTYCYRLILTVTGWLSDLFSVMIGVLTKISLIRESIGTSLMSLTFIDCLGSNIFAVWFAKSLYIPFTKFRNFWICCKWKMWVIKHLLQMKVHIKDTRECSGWKDPPYLHMYLQLILTSWHVFFLTYPTSIMILTALWLSLNWSWLFLSTHTHWAGFSYLPVQRYSDELRILSLTTM